MLPIKKSLKVKYHRKGCCIRVDGRGVAIDRLISSHIRSIGTLGPTYNIRSKISAASNSLKFALNTLYLKFKYSTTEQLNALKWFFWYPHGVSASIKPNLKLVGNELDEKYSFNWKHINSLKFAPNTLYLKFKYSTTEQLIALKWFFWHPHGVSASVKPNLKLVGNELDEKYNFHWKHIFGYSADWM